MTPNKCLVYLQKHELNVIKKIDPITFSYAIFNPNSSKCINAMKDKLALMHKN